MLGSYKEVILSFLSIAVIIVHFKQLPFSSVLIQSCWIENWSSSHNPKIYIGNLFSVLIMLILVKSNVKLWFSNHVSLLCNISVLHGIKYFVKCSTPKMHLTSYIYKNVPNFNIYHFNPWITLVSISCIFVILRRFLNEDSF